MSNPSQPPDSPAFFRSFERWRSAITSLALPTLSTPLRCEPSAPNTSPSPNQLTNKPEWEDGAIMQNDTPEEALDPVGLDKQRKREAKDCKRCEQMRDELTRESKHANLEPLTLSQATADARSPS